MLRHQHRGEEGQIFLALLLFVLVLATFAFAVIQLGSAGDQKTQTQSAADAAAIAGAKALAADFFLHLGPPMDGSWLIIGSFPTPNLAAQSAANTAWDANAHKAYPTTVVQQVDATTVRATVTAPPGEIASGPVKSASKAQAVATATASFRLRCAPGLSALNHALNLVTQALGSPLRCLVPTTTATTTTTIVGTPVPPPVNIEPVNIELKDLLKLVDVVLVA